MGWSISIAKEIESIDRIIVSTDDQSIAELAREYGADVPFIRPDHLATDNCPEWLVWEHAIAYLENQENDFYDGVIVLPPTSPLRSKVDIENCLEVFEGGDVEVVVTVSEAQRSPAFNMGRENSSGYFELYDSETVSVYRRQDAPKVYDMTTVAYISSPKTIKSQNGVFDGRVKAVLIPSERSVDIDTELDFAFAELIFNRNFQGV